MEEVLNPRRCRNALELREALIEMDQKGRELARYGQAFVISEPQWILALEKRLPHDLLRTLEDQMLPIYRTKRRFVQNRVGVEQARALKERAAQAARFPGSPPSRGPCVSHPAKQEVAAPSEF